MTKFTQFVYKSQAPNHLSKRFFSAHAPSLNHHTVLAVEFGGVGVPCFDAR
jgi:hypothetical protein